MTTLGAGWYLATRTDLTTDLLPWLVPETLRSVWSDRAVLKLGFQFSIPTLFILFCHEMGHYLYCLRYRLPATLPYFIPAPLGLGTFGAFIRIRAALRTKAELFDVGVGGPIAGFIALLPFLVYGIAHSTPSAIEILPAAEGAGSDLIVPGRSLLIQLVTYFFHGSLPSGSVMDLHPFALAAWVGLLATSLNLLPLGQLDGGHILYAVLGRWQRRLAWPSFAGLALIGVFFWKGWLIWALISLFVGLRHPPVIDERSPLDGKRKILALCALLIFILSFMPIPVELAFTR